MACESTYIYSANRTHTMSSLNSASLQRITVYDKTYFGDLFTDSVNQGLITCLDLIQITSLIVPASDDSQYPQWNITEGASIARPTAANFSGSGSSYGISISYYLGETYIGSVTYTSSLGFEDNITYPTWPIFIGPGVSDGKSLTMIATSAVTGFPAIFSVSMPGISGFTTTADSFISCVVPVCSTVIPTTPYTGFRIAFPLTNADNGLVLATPPLFTRVDLVNHAKSMNIFSFLK